MQSQQILQIVLTKKEKEMKKEKKKEKSIKKRKKN